MTLVGLASLPLVFPGLVLGLDHGGACRGIAFRVAVANRAATVQYLRGDKSMGNFYVDLWRSIACLFVPVAFVVAVMLIDESLRGQKFPSNMSQ